MTKSAMLVKVLIIFASFYVCTTFAINNKVAVNILHDQVQNTINEDRVKYQLPALSVSLILPGQKDAENFVSGYYSQSQDKKITTDTLFQIGSITKTFTATIILKLVEDKKLRLNQRITQWLPQYPRWNNITVENLLRHTSGISNYTHGKDFDRMLRRNPKKYLSLNELANIAYNHADLFTPGKKYNYTNTDYILLGMIIEKVTHQPLQQVFDIYLKKYRLFNTFYTPAGYPKQILSRIAHGYNRDGTFKSNEDVTFVSLSFAQSAGAIISTPNDLINWLYQLFTGKIVTDKSLANMMTAVSEVTAKPLDIGKLHLPGKHTKSTPVNEIGEGIGMGLVYFKSNDIAWAHAGGTPGYESFYIYDPCKNIYLVLMYNVKPKQQFIFSKIASDILDVLNKSISIKKDVKNYQQNHTLPVYCN